MYVLGAHIIRPESLEETSDIIHLCFTLARLFSRTFLTECFDHTTWRSPPVAIVQHSTSTGTYRYTNGKTKETNYVH